MRIVLASGSPRRAEILRGAGIAFEVMVSAADELRLPGETGSVMVRRLAEGKARAVAATLGLNANGAEPIFVIGADTVVEIDTEAKPQGSLRSAPRRSELQQGGGDVEYGDILGKPTDAADARAMLRRIRGARHRVLTGIALLRLPDEVLLTDMESTTVHFSEMTDAEIDDYVATGEPLDKAGAYAIQGIAGRYIERIEGCYFNVVGLPVARLHRMLGVMGWDART